MKPSHMVAAKVQSYPLILPSSINHEPKYYESQNSNQYSFQLDQNYIIQHGPEYLPRQQALNTQKIVHEFIHKITWKCVRCDINKTTEWGSGPNGIGTICYACALYHQNSLNLRLLQLLLKKVWAKI